MCGIAGIICRNGIDGSDLARMADAISHRGPDGDGVWFSQDGFTGFAHRRLAIIDTSDRGLQPMSSSDGRYTLLFNGEIFNFLELRVELEALGSKFRSDSDSEVIIEAWRHWGEAMQLRFNGMWAIALYDAETDEIFFSRDRFGVKPLLYFESHERFAFASEMRALRSLSWVSSDLDLSVAQRMLFDPFSIEGSDRSIYAGVKRLPAGHCARLVNGALKVSRWWRTVDHLPQVPADPAEREARFRELFFDAVRLRMRSDVSLGTCLSGGFDSSAIVAAMSHVAGESTPHLREAKSWRHAFIAAFPGESNDEEPQALEAAAYAGVTPHVMRMGRDDALQDIEQVLADLDDIYISLTSAPWQIYRELRRDGTLVSLDGHGADELMGAYRQEGQSFGFALRNYVARIAAQSPLAHRIVDAAKLARLRMGGYYFLRHPQWLAPTAPVIASDSDALPDHWGMVNRRLYRMFHGTVLPTILRNFDRLSMAHGIEVRMPFMDWRLVTYVMALPDEAKYADGYSKAIARDALAGYMPESIRTNRRKVGFNSPMPGWLNGKLGAWAADLVQTPHAQFDAIVDSPALLRRIQGLTQSGKWDWESVGRLWPYINLKWWLLRDAKSAQ